MKKIDFFGHVLPHIIAISVFLIVTLVFFKPVFFENKVLSQHDIQQFEGTSKTIVDYRKQTGEEALWAESVFSGMPAYLISVQWGNAPVSYLKEILSLGLPNAVNNIFLAFLCYYIMLISFGVRPYLAIGGALAFGLSSYMMIGVLAGHNARVGAIAFMPLVVAGIHIAFTRSRLLGLGVATAGLALHLRDNHLQMTYYLFIIVIVYGIIQLIDAVRTKKLTDFFKTIGVLVVAAVLAIGTFFGPFWAITEYTAYSIRGRSELAAANPGESKGESSGLSRQYAFDYSNGILEPMTLLIPNFYGGSTASSVLEDRQSETFKELQRLANSGDQQTLNQLYRYTVPYWGPQFNTSPYYAGAIIVFLFAVGIAFAPRKYVWWLLPISIFSVMLSWGKSFEAFNYFLFDYLPGYNKFRSVTFALVIILFAMPLLGFLGFEKLVHTGLDSKSKRKLWVAFGATGGVCLLLVLFAGIFSFTKEGESDLPDWFVNALVDDRKGLLRADALRSLGFIIPVFAVIYFELHKKISPAVVYLVLTILVVIDLAVVDKRYLKNDNFRRKNDKTYIASTEADQEILKDDGYYRVYNLNPRSPFAAFTEAKTSYYHKSIGGYHGAKLRRYQDYIDSCFYQQVQQFINLASQGNFDFRELHGFNMLNVKYIYYGPERGNVITNTSANGNAWFARQIERVKTPAEELARTCSVNTKTTAVIDESAFKIPDVTADSAATIRLTSHAPNALTYESESGGSGLAVFSEIYYPKGWHATIDGEPAEILRANYLLRALYVPAGKHKIEFRFVPKAYTVGNKITAASSWAVVLLLVVSMASVFREKEPELVKK